MPRHETELGIMRRVNLIGEAMRNPVLRMRSR
jgi:hypothetical protein